MRKSSMTNHLGPRSNLISRVAGLTTIAVLAFAASACSVNMVPEKDAKDGNGNSTDSDGLALPANTNGVATISLPEALLVESMRGGVRPGEPEVSRRTGADTEKNAVTQMKPKLDVICLQGRGRGEPENEKAREGMRPIRHMGELIQGVTLKATLVESVEGKSSREESLDKTAAKIAELQKEVHCRDLVVLLQNLPVDRKMSLRVEFKGEKVAFAGVTREFSYNGKQTVGLKVPFDRVDVTNDRPRIMPVGIVLFKDAAAKEVHDIVGDQASRVVCDSESKRCRVAGNEIEAEKAARLTDIMKSRAEKPLETGAQGRLLGVHQLRCDDTECTGFPLTLR